MGSLFGSSLRSPGFDNSIWSPPTPTALVPTPDNFVVEKVERFGALFVSAVTFPGCLNYEGRKVLVTEWNPFLVDQCDPHFLPNSGLLARFEPTDRGFQWARDFAARAAEEYP